MQRNIRRLLLLLTACLCLAGAFPFFFRWAGAETRETVSQQMLLFRESGKLRISDEDSLAFRLWEYVAGRMDNPGRGASVKDTGWVHVLSSGIGSCDQQAMILIRLARSYDLDARLIFLYGADSISGHSVAEIRLAGQWCMFDPFYGTVFPDENGRPCGVKKLTDEQWRLFSGPRRTIPGHAIPDDSAYRRMFDKKNPFVVFSDNRIGEKAACWFRVMRLYSSIPGAPFERLMLER